MALVRQNFAEFLKSLQTLYFALLGGQVIALIVFYLLPAGQESTLPDSGMAVRIPLVAVILLAAAFFLGRKRIEAAREETELKAKISAYRTAVILRCALLEGGVLLAGIFFFLERNLLLLAFAALGVGVFLLFIPSRARVVADLDLSTQEQAMLDDPNVIVTEYERRP